MASHAAEAKADPRASRELKIQYGPIHSNNSNMLRALNVAVFPVRYNEKFYADVVKLPGEYTMYAWYGEFVVGAVCCRREDNVGYAPAQGGEGPASNEATADENKRPKKLYIMTLGVLAAWRGRGIGKRLLQKVLKNTEQEDTLDHIYLHVQTSNAAAIAFYDNFGFENVGMIPNYYKRIEPPDCYILRKSLSGASCELPESSAGNAMLDETARGEAEAPVPAPSQQSS